MALDWCQNCVFVQYLWNGLIEVVPVMQMHWYWQDVELDGYNTLFCVSL